MTLAELDIWFKNVLAIEQYAQIDPSKNGLQVDNDGSKIKKIAFAVDACFMSFEKAIKEKAEMLFVHHGLFWKEPVCIINNDYKRIKFLIENNLALYACHLPLDGNQNFGHNSGLASLIGLINIEPFVKIEGLPIGVKGRFPEPLSLDEVLDRLFPQGEAPLAVLPFGPKKIQTVGLVSGGAPREVHQAMKENLDLFITGEMSHEVYHPCLENNISMIAGGHYYTETIGLKLLAKKLAQETEIETVFLDIPTGL